MQPLHQIRWDERCISRNADDPFAVGAMYGAPFESRQDACQRSQITCNRIRYDRKAHILESGEIAIRIDDHAFTLRDKTLCHMIEKREPLENEEVFVAAAHASRKAAR